MVCWSFKLFSVVFRSSFSAVKQIYRFNSGFSSRMSMLRESTRILKSFSDLSMISNIILTSIWRYSGYNYANSLNLDSLLIAYIERLTRSIFFLVYYEISAYKVKDTILFISSDLLFIRLKKNEPSLPMTSTSK